MKPKEIDLGFKIYDNKLRDIKLPVEKINISEIIGNADICYLEKEGTNDWNLSPYELIKNFKIEISHAQRVEAADLKYPICIYWFKGKWIILDGIHRFTKAIMNGDKGILVKKIPMKIVEKIKK